MADMTRIELFPGVSLTAVHTKKFKSSVLGVQFLSPLSAETASANALVPSVLRRGTARHLDMEALSAALDELYGGSIEPVVRTRGETQCVGFLGSFLDDAYTLDGSPVLEQAAALLGELLLEPYTEHGVFCPDYTAGERANLIDRIRAQINEKRSYAVKRLKEEMCAGEPFGVTGWEMRPTPPPSRRSSCGRVTRTCSAAPPSRSTTAAPPRPNGRAGALRAALAGLPQGGARTFPGRPAPHAAPDVPREVVEAMDVTQGKLTMGLRTGIQAWDDAYPALLLLNAVFGGTTTSKLFLNVREKLSLCYYASSGLMHYKDVMVVSSGVDFDKVEAARAEILAQLSACKAGQFEDWELEGARRSVVSALRSSADAQSRLEEFWLGQAVAGLSESPEDLAARVEAVTRAQVVEAAQKLALDTVYFLKGKEA